MEKESLCPLTCVFPAVHLQMGQLKVPLAAAGMSAHKRALLAGLCLGSWRSDTGNPSHILDGEDREDKPVWCSLNKEVFILRGLLSLTDLDSPEDAVYVVLSTDQHGWRRDRRVAVVADGMSAAGNRGKL